MWYTKVKPLNIKLIIVKTVSLVCFMKIIPIVKSWKNYRKLLNKKSWLITSSSIVSESCIVYVFTTASQIFSKHSFWKAELFSKPIYLRKCLYI